MSSSGSASGSASIIYSISNASGYSHTPIQSESQRSSGNSGSQNQSYMSGSGVEGKIKDVKFLQDIADAGILRKILFSATSTKGFNYFVLLIILLNTIVLALQTTPFQNSYGYFLQCLDSVFLAIYTLEAVTKIIAYRKYYFKDGWNVFDLVTVVTSYVTFILPELFSIASSFDTKIFRLFRVLRAFRAIRSLRVLRTIRFLRSLQIIVSTIIQSLPAMSNIVALAGLVLYIFAVIGRTLYGQINTREFGSLGVTLFTLFRVLTLDNWSIIVRTSSDPSMFWFFFVFIILETFIFLNLIVAVLVNNLQANQHMLSRRLKKKKKKSKDEEIDEIQIDLDSGAKDENREKLANQGFGLDFYYPKAVNEQKRKLISSYFSQLSTLEYHMDFFKHQQLLLDSLVNMVQVKNQEEKE